MTRQEFEAILDRCCEILTKEAVIKDSFTSHVKFEKPDIAITKYKIAIFCDSEFFHGKDWEVLKPQLEKSNNAEFWTSKISRNIERDDEVNKQLLFLGWTVIRFWGKEIKKTPRNAYA